MRNPGVSFGFRTLALQASGPCNEAGPWTGGVRVSLPLLPLLLLTVSPDVSEVHFVHCQYLSVSKTKGRLWTLTCLDVFFLLLQKTTASRYNSYAIKFTLLECTIRWFLNIFTKLHNHHHHLILGPVCHFRKKLVPWITTGHSPLPLPQPLAATVHSPTSHLGGLAYSACVTYIGLVSLASFA